MGMLKIDGKVISKPAKNRGVFGWDKSYTFFFDRLAKGENDLKSSFYSHAWWHEATNIVGGAPLLILNGAILSFEPEATLESFLQNKYARTAVCIDAHKQLKLFVVDGGDSKTQELGGGMNMLELATFLLKQGCQNAINLDGGYSSSFVFHGEKKNRFNLDSLPERPVSTMLLVLPK